MGTKPEKRKDGWYVSDAGIEVWITLFSGMTIGSGTGQGDAFGEDATAAVRVARVNAKEDAWLDVGQVVHSWAQPWRSLRLGQYPNEMHIDLQARTDETAIRKAVPYIVGWALHHFYQGK